MVKTVGELKSARLSWVATYFYNGSWSNFKI